MSNTPRPVSRRRFLARFAAAGAVVGASGVLAACGGGGAPTTAAACEGYAGIAPEALQIRQTFQYVDRSPDAAKNCANCLQFEEASGACGGCKLFAGPVIAKGYCTGWVAIPAA